MLLTIVHWYCKPNLIKELETEVHGFLSLKKLGYCGMNIRRWLVKPRLKWVVQTWALKIQKRILAAVG